MLKHVLVMPFAYQPYADECYASMSNKLTTLLVDNTIDNKGVSTSWNLGIDELYEIYGDWLIIVSATMRFGDPGGLDMLEQLEKHPFAQVVHFAKEDVPEQPYIRGQSPGDADGVFGWHCTAINRRIIDRVGKFDENFHPAYFEDIDYDIRINKAFPDVNWLILPIKATSMGIGHGVKLGKVSAPSVPNMQYFVKKWGDYPKPTFDVPFGDDLPLQDAALAYWPRPERYQ